MVLKSLEGKKTKIGLVVYLVLAVLGGVFGMIPENMLTQILEPSSLALIGYGLYDKADRKK